MKHANVIDSHFMYKVKVEDSEKKRLKSRLCTYGNRDRMKGHIRNESASARLKVIRPLLSTATLLQLSIGCLEIQGAYL